MRASTLLSVAATASLSSAAAIPIPQGENLGVLKHPDHWSITGFAITGTTYSFSATVEPGNVPNPVKCTGSTTASAYIKCAYINADDTVWAYIAGGTTLKLQYEFLAHEVDTAYYFFGETADLTSENFAVSETPNSLKAIKPIPKK